MSRFIFIIVLIAVVFQTAAAENGTEWPLWQQFKSNFITSNGRVIDPYQNKNVTTSEGQSYAMFFALVNNDKDTFDKLLTWTEQYLAPKGFAKQLPAWLYGRKNRRLQILDANSASDSDVWIVYSLLQAEKLWGDTHYRTLAQQLAKGIIKRETYQHKTLGLVLLPGPEGFVEQSTVRLNPSYLPLQILEVLANSNLGNQWKEILLSSFHILMISGKSGIYPDWITVNSEGLILTRETAGYEAIRTYLWNATLHEQSHFAPKLNVSLVKAGYYFDKVGFVPEKINPELLTYIGHGNIGHTVSILPLAQKLSLSKLSDHLQNKVSQHDFSSNQSYYSHALALFSLGFIDGRYHFSKHGDLIVDWDVD